MTYNPPELIETGIIATGILMSILLLVVGIFVYTNYQEKQRIQNFNLCDETWFNARFPTSLSEENIPFRDATSLNYLKECSNK